jgi:hypothetical protein
VGVVRVSMTSTLRSASGERTSTSCWICWICWICWAQSRLVRRAVTSTQRCPALPSERLTAEKELDDALACVRIIHAGRATGRGWLAGARVAQQLLGGLVQAHQWAARVVGARVVGARVVGARVDLQDVFHAPDEVAVGFGWDAPLPPQVLPPQVLPPQVLPPQVRLARGLFSRRRTV